MKVAGIGVALVALLGACGSSSKSSTPATTPPTTAPPATTSTTAPPNPYKATVTPDTNLKAGDSVTVSVSGFTAGKTVGINECSTTTDNSGSGCDLGGIKTMTIKPDGTASSKFTI
ncbi:MAG TPA: neocarzinostatin apoprotein domain-containing protein, partial [Acidimicrobiia bacterium]|nr:neocarzinostatin apoprotein domain-containing protein [Acidimicrobiia bacterium]